MKLLSQLREDQAVCFISRLQRSTVSSVRPWGAAPGYYISRLWRFQTNGIAYRSK